MKHKDCLLDTNVIRYLLEIESGGRSRECLSVKNRLNALPGNVRIVISPITVGEVEYGIRVAPFNESEQDKQHALADILDKYFCLDINKEAAQRYYAVIRARLFEKYAPKTKKGSKTKKKRIEEWMDPTTSKDLQVQENDVWIAALAWAFNLRLVTDDKMIPIKSVVGDAIDFENWIR